MNQATTKSDATKGPSPAKPVPSDAHSVKNSVRETIESIVIAFVLAFLFRTFEAEAFVIPTGSMAPTLMGRHKDVECTMCRFPFRVGDSEDRSDLSSWNCPNCGYKNDYRAPGPDSPKMPPTENGDRIIVTKFVYDFADPKRWDVSVFKYPAQAKTNFIKRIVGLPHETLMIKGGNIHTGPEGATLDDIDQFVLQRKPPEKVLAMLQMVYDNDYVLPWIVERGFLPRWYSQTPGGWVSHDDGKSFSTDGGPGDETVWLRYQNVMPNASFWQMLQDGGPLLEPLRREIRPRPIRDINPYNAGPGGTDGHNEVGDLAVECEVTVEAPGGKLTLELVQAQRRFRCTIDLATGKATLSGDGLAKTFQPQADTKMRGPGTYNLRFSDVDDQLLLWIDESLVTFDTPTTYDVPIERTFGELDAKPVVIGSQGAKLKVDHLRVLRDVFYIAESFREGGGQNILESRSGVVFSLGDGQFLALGDNSSRSKDSRLWSNIDANGQTEYYVHRDLLIGKAMYVYWPHALDHVPGTNVPFPLFPNFKRMKFIR